MNFAPFSKKQLAVLSWWHPGSPFSGRDAVICDGAVRSGKTLCMSLSFVFWTFFRFENMSFALCGKTVTSLKRNLVTPLLAELPQLGFSVNYVQSRGLIELTLDGRKNRFYLFGGRDESSASLIQGMTLGGVLLDEVALMPRSFVEQALARCSVEGSKFWFNCNPENPSHWFYVTWIKSAKVKNALYIHFEMADNPSLSADILQRYRTLYSGAFYERFVRGKWVAAEGLVYPLFNDRQNVCDVPRAAFERYYISCDYGTVNPCSMGLWGLWDGVWYRIAEYYYSSKREKAQKTDEEYYAALVKLAGDKKIESVVCDPSAASFIACIKRHGRFHVIPAKNDVVNGIRQVADALAGGQIRICRNCCDSLREFTLYRWDEGAQTDRPIKENDHAMDDIRYFVATVLAKDRDSGFFAFAARRK